MKVLVISEHVTLGSCAKNTGLYKAVETVAKFAGAKKKAKNSCFVEVH